MASARSAAGRRDPPYDARLYAAVHDGTPGDLAFYRAVCHGVTSVLELGCGYGRVLEALVDRVPRLVGLDLDEGLLALATERLAISDRPMPELVRADMTTFDLRERFDRVLVPHSGLFCLLDDRALHACLACVREHVGPDGLLVFDVYEADSFHDEAEPDDLDPDTLVFVKTVQVEGRVFDVYERSTWDRAQQRIDATYVHVPVDGGPPVEGTIRQRYLTRAQLVGALEAAGWTPREVRAGFDRGREDGVVVVAAPTRDRPERTPRGRSHSAGRS